MALAQQIQEIIDNAVQHTPSKEEREEEERIAKARHQREWSDAYMQCVRVDNAILAFERPELTASIQAVRAWRHAGITRHLLLMGDVGCGKSIAAAYALKAYLEPGRHRGKCAWFSPDELTDAMSRPAWDEARVIPHYAVIDDLGTERAPGFSEALCRFVDLAGRVAIMTTNLSPVAFKRRYDLRLIDRLRASCTVSRSLGKSLRVPVGDF